MYYSYNYFKSLETLSYESVPKVEPRTAYEGVDLSATAAAAATVAAVTLLYLVYSATEDPESKASSKTDEADSPSRLTAFENAIWGKNKKL